MHEHSFPDIKYTQTACDTVYMVIHCLSYSKSYNNFILLAIQDTYSAWQRVYTYTASHAVHIQHFVLHGHISWCTHDRTSHWVDVTIHSYLPALSMTVPKNKYLQQIMSLSTKKKNECYDTKRAAAQVRLVVSHACQSCSGWATLLVLLSLWLISQSSALWLCPVLSRHHL